MIILSPFLSGHSLPLDFGLPDPESLSWCLIKATSPVHQYLSVKRWGTSSVCFLGGINSSGKSFENWPIKVNLKFKVQ